MSMEPKRAYKIVLIGDPEVGKTSIRRRYMGKSFRTDYLKTLGADFAAQKVNVDGEIVLLTIWDLAGQAIFHGMRSSFYHGCKCALVVFDVTNAETLKNTIKWADEAANYAKNSLQEIYLIGNKIDLEDKRVVTYEQIEETARTIQERTNYNVRIYETSALTGKNINELFEHMSKRLILGDIRHEKISPKVAKTTEVTKPTTDQIVIPDTEIGNLIKEIESHINNAQTSLMKLKEILRKSS